MLWKTQTGSSTDGLSWFVWMSMRWQSVGSTQKSCCVCVCLKGNKAFNSRLGEKPGGMAALAAFGFELTDDPKSKQASKMLVLPYRA